MKFNIKFLKAKTAKHYPSEDNPYLNARRSWNSHVAGLMSSLQIWQFVGLMSLTICLTAVAGVTYIGSQSKFIPLIFQEDRAGNVLSVTKATKVPDAKVDDFRTAALRFIENIRLVSSDRDLQVKAVNQTFAYISANDPAAKKATEFLNGSPDVNPLNRALKENVHVEIISVLQQTEKTWQVEWRETVNAIDGKLKEPPFLMRAILTLYQSKLTDNASNVEVLRNPHFIFVEDFNWTKQLYSGH